MNKFQLNSSFDPAGDQKNAISALVEGLNDGLHYQTLLGVTGSGKTYTMANVIAQTNRPALIMVHNKTLAAQLYEEFKNFFPNNAVEYFVSYYDYYQPEAYVPSKDLFIEKSSAINEQIEQMRLSASKAILERPDVIIIATVSAIYGIGAKESYANMTLKLKAGEKIERGEIISQLVKMQYLRAEVEFKRSTFRVRGENIDIFPSECYDLAVRVVIDDDGTIDSLRMFDPISGQLINKVDKFNIFASSHYVSPKDMVNHAIANIEEELKTRIAYFKKLGKASEAFRIEQRTNFDLELLREIGFCKGIENYTRHLNNSLPGEPPATLIDYMPNNAILFVDESHVTIPQIGGMYGGDRARKENLVEYGYRLPSALDNRPLKFDEFEKKMPQTIFVSATPGEYEAVNQLKIVEQIVRPTGLLDPIIEIYPLETQVQHLLEEIKSRIKVGERVMVTTVTKKMSERLSEYYIEQGIRAKYLHSDIDTVERMAIIRDLRLGVFDVLIGVNLLREGLDVPEVSLIAITDADKEGFLRSTRSLIQTVGRAARHINGKAIFYADKMTDAMQYTINETTRRRSIQLEYNHNNNIVPQTIIKPISDIISGLSSGEKNSKNASASGDLNHKNIEKAIANLNKKMHKYVDKLNFEEAAKCRDEIKTLESLLLR
jgi:excinuclease ABC subunit B